MINKRSLWFLTLFSLILVLSVYYITMPSELLLTNKNDNPNDNKPVVEIEESEILTALRIEANEQLMKEMNSLKEILTSVETSVEEKNNAFEKMKLLNVNRGEEEKLEKQILDEFKLKSFVKIDGDQIRIVVAKDKHDETLANNIMRKIQSNFDKKMYISVKFQQ
ncbi:MAG: SpoIIIAH-like family protein [Mollicutes bacterium]|nr:SpoIIIAH-like family protein [Mollicutes bacterium]